MGAFFHGWRRKVGCVTLGVACLLMAVWIRSNRTLDDVDFAIDTRQWAIVSGDGDVYCFYWLCSPARFRWETSDIAREPKGVPYVVHQARFFVRDGSGCRASYWSLVLSLTLLSAYLILWKPRKRA